MRLAWPPLLIAALLATAAHAQTSSDTIDVTGRTPEQVRKQAQAFVRATGVADDGRPVARWAEPVCPRVLGVSAEIGRRVADKVREVARGAGIAVARAPCRTNIAISFAGDGGAIVRALAAKAPGRLVEVAADDRAALLDGDAPVRWWHATEMRTRDGMGTTGNESPPFALGRAGGVMMAGEVHFQYNSSIASTRMVRVLKAGTVVIDVNRATGMPLDSVAAFAAMVSLAEIQPSEAPPRNSILSLFENGGSRDLTTLDENFLRALYRLPLDRTALAQRGLLVRGLLDPADRDGN
ncbi:hypothetical protein [Sphingomonas sp. CGMCC 1.13658]|uniref:hypothetical protein n=1 Tax=Sphingomonas sp. CGMCC 1.13658 TaxID=2755554 RepID=UPI0012ED96B5|nr:hypothetical protein [Sphingomonas sp. CGMCC 1.13658]MBA2919511.1 hypothetical protein [Sphingomonas sp. CGMCC 1.13658]